MTGARGALAPWWARILIGGAWAVLAWRAIALALPPKEPETIGWVAVTAGGASAAADLDRRRPRPWLALGGAALMVGLGLGGGAISGAKGTIIGSALALAVIGAARAGPPRFHGAFVAAIVPILAGAALLASVDRQTSDDLVRFLVGVSLTSGLALAQGWQIEWPR